MADLTKYNSLLAWFTVAANTYLLTPEDVDNVATFRISVKYIDPNNAGAGLKAIGYTFTDNIGVPYNIIAVNTNSIDVADVFRQGCPVNDKIGIVHKSAYKGYSVHLPSELLYRLHPMAASNNNKFAMSVLWGNDPNGLRIPFTASSAPSITNYQSDQTIEGVLVNLAEDYGDNPGCDLFEERIDDFLGTPIELIRSERQVNNTVDGKIDSIIFGLADVISGYMLIYRK